MKARRLFALVCTATLFAAAAQADEPAVSLPLPPGPDPSAPPPVVANADSGMQSPPAHPQSGPFQSALAPPSHRPLDLHTTSPRRGARGQHLYQVLLARFDSAHRGYLTPNEQTQAMAFLQMKRPRVYEFVVRRFPSPSAFFQYLSHLLPSS
ncbi:MAG TPA: hypothetical protein VGL42_16645 [Opitutaceae bacterium]|jgi:hypothetical protein